MVDVIEDLDAWGIDALYHLHSPGHVVELIVLVVHLAVENLETDRDVVFFRNRLHAIEANDAVLQPLGIGEAAPVSGEGDDVGPARSGRARDPFLVKLFELFVVLLPVESVRDFGFSPDHRADEPVLLEDGPLLGSIDKIDSLQAHFGHRPRELLERDFFHAPARDRLFEASLHGRRSFCRQRRSMDVHHDGRSQTRCCHSQRLTARKSSGVIHEWRAPFPVS